MPTYFIPPLPRTSSPPPLTLSRGSQSRSSSISSNYEFVYASPTQISPNATIVGNPNPYAVAPSRPSPRRAGFFEPRPSPIRTPPEEQSDSSSPVSDPYYRAVVRDLTGSVQKLRPAAVARGGFSDIYLGALTPSGELVAIKVLRIAGVDEERLQRKLQRRIERELTTWQRLNHPNILPLYGTCDEEMWLSEAPVLVSPWMSNKSVDQYIANNPATRRLPLVRGVAAGLEYMHSMRIVHGDLKGPNVLIDGAGQPKISDFGLSRARRETTGSHPAPDQTSSWAGSIRWMAPELHEQDIPMVTLYSDVYAFASTALQIFSGAPPYLHIRQEFQVVFAIINNVLPPRPLSTELTDEMWTMLLSCWAYTPSARSRMVDVVRAL